MDGRGRIAQSLNFFARLRARPTNGGAARACARSASPRNVHAWVELPAAAAPLLDPAARGSGAARDRRHRGHCADPRRPRLRRHQRRPRDEAASHSWRTRATRPANAVGFDVTDLTVTGPEPVRPRKRCWPRPGDGSSSLLFLDADETRERAQGRFLDRRRHRAQAVPGQLQIESRSASRSRCGRRTGAWRSSPTTGPCSKVSSRRNC